MSWARRAQIIAGRAMTSAEAIEAAELAAAEIRYRHQMASRGQTARAEAEPKPEPELEAI